MTPWEQYVLAWNNEPRLLKKERAEHAACRERTEQEAEAVEVAEYRRGYDAGQHIFDETRIFVLGEADPVYSIPVCTEQFCGADGFGPCPGCGWDPFNYGGKND